MENGLIISSNSWQESHISPHLGSRQHCDRVQGDCCPWWADPSGPRVLPHVNVSSRVWERPWLLLTAKPGSWDVAPAAPGGLSCLVMAAAGEGPLRDWRSHGKEPGWPLGPQEVSVHSQHAAGPLVRHPQDRFCQRPDECGPEGSPLAAALHSV